MKFPPLRLLPLLVLLLSSCAAPDPGKVRRKEAEDYASLLGKGASSREPWSLEECLAVALEKGFASREAALRREIASYKAQAAGRALLLPAVSVSLVHTDRSNKPLVGFPLAGRELQFPMMDKRIRVVRAEADLPLLDLSRWFLAAQAERGAEIQGYLAQAAKQRIRAEVTARYGALAALEASLPALESRVKADALRLADLEALEREGLLRPQQKEGAALALSRSRDRLRSLKREVLQARRELEQALGLPPAGKIRIRVPFRLAPPKGNLEELVFQALLRRPELFASDRAVLLQEEKARKAVADFLPKLLLSAGLQSTTDSAQVHKFWAFGGLTLFVDLFDGLAKVSRLEGAGREEKLARLERQELYGTVLLQVARAFQDFQDARDGEARAVETLRLAREEADRGKKLFSEGYLRKADLAALDASLAGARAALESARVRLAVAAAFLRLAVGPAGEKKGRSSRKEGGKR